jgi:probable DNA metabolism protein
VPTPAAAAATEELACALGHGERVVLVCEPTAEGVLTAVAATYLAHADASRLRLASAASFEPTLLERTVRVPEDPRLAIRVYQGLERRCARGCPRAKGGRCGRGCEKACARRVVYACASDSPAMPDAVLRYVRRAFEAGPRIRDMLADPDVAPMEDLARSVANECERTRQFVRFSELKDGSFWGVFRPKADTLPLTSGYFAARMGTERFCLVDPVHATAALHDRRLEVVRLDEALLSRLMEDGSHIPSSDERYVRAMWQSFYDAMELQGRRKEQRGYDLRTSWMPRRLWAGLPELAPRSADAGPAPERYRGTPGRAIRAQVPPE